MNGLGRFLYLLSRALGDASAAQHHRLGRRLVRRAERRALFGLLRRW